MALEYPQSEITAADEVQEAETFNEENPSILQRLRGWTGADTGSSLDAQK